jgi:hypothetical protein
VIGATVLLRNSHAPRNVQKLLRFRPSLERDLAGLIGRGIRIDERAVAELLVHFIVGTHELRVLGPIKQVKLARFLGRPKPRAQRPRAEP